VYDLTFDDQVIALQQSTGERLWHTTIANSNNGISESSPGTYWIGEYIVGGAESDAGIRGAVQAFNANTGKLLWRRCSPPHTTNVTGSLVGK
jgi:alcohol dehydrogenase (cytochrome c)